MCTTSSLTWDQDYFKQFLSTVAGSWAWISEFCSVWVVHWCCVQDAKAHIGRAEGCCGWHRHTSPTSPKHQGIVPGFLHIVEKKWDYFSKRRWREMCTLENARVWCHGALAWEMRGLGLCSESDLSASRLSQVQKLLGCWLFLGRLVRFFPPPVLVWAWKFILDVRNECSAIHWVYPSSSENRVLMKFS